MASNIILTTDDYDFVTEPDSGLQCVICLTVAEDPWQHGKCGRLLCNKCLRKLGRDMPCPNCRMEQPQYFEDNKSMMEREGGREGRREGGSRERGREKGGEGGKGGREGGREGGHVTTFDNQLEGPVVVSCGKPLTPVLK